MPRDPIELEPASGITPQADTRKHMPEPPPVRLVAVEDVHLPAAAGLETELDRFYVDLLKFVRGEHGDGLIVYHAENASLVFDVLEPPVEREKIVPTQIELLFDEQLFRQGLLEREIPFEFVRGVYPATDHLLLQDPAGNWLAVSQRRVVV